MKGAPTALVIGIGKGKPSEADGGDEDMKDGYASDDDSDAEPDAGQALIDAVASKDGQAVYDAIAAAVALCQGKH